MDEVGRFNLWFVSHLFLAVLHVFYIDIVEKEKGGEPQFSVEDGKWTWTPKYKFW